MFEIDLFVRYLPAVTNDGLNIKSDLKNYTKSFKCSKNSGEKGIFQSNIFLIVVK
jgi:hypothetical protein